MLGYPQSTHFLQKFLAKETYSALFITLIPHAQQNSGASNCALFLTKYHHKSNEAAEPKLVNPDDI